MRKLIAAMKITVDGRMQGPEAAPDWVDAWSEDYGLTQDVDACLLGGGMYPGYERYWTSIQSEPDNPVWITGAAPTPAEREWASFAARTPHYVLSSTLTATNWPQTHFVRSVDDLTALKQQSGKGIYLVGGARTVASLIDAGLVDELRLIVYPLLSGAGRTLFETSRYRRKLELQHVHQVQDGRLHLRYAIA